MAIHIPNKIVSRIMRVTCKELLDNTDSIIPISVRIFGVIKENEIIYSDSITNAENTAIKKYLLLDKTIYMTLNIFISFIFIILPVPSTTIFLLLARALSLIPLCKCRYNIHTMDKPHHYSTDFFLPFYLPPSFVLHPHRYLQNSSA